MHSTKREDWQHDHTLGRDQVSKGERRTLCVALLTAVFAVLMAWESVDRQGHRLISLNR